MDTTKSAIIHMQYGNDTTLEIRGVDLGLVKVLIDKDESCVDRTSSSMSSIVLRGEKGLIAYIAAPYLTPVKAMMLKSYHSLVCELADAEYQSTVDTRDCRDTAPVYELIEIKLAVLNKRFITTVQWME